MSVPRPAEHGHALYFDYDRQAWVRAGRYVRCSHPKAMDCVCYGRLHEGEPAPASPTNNPNGDAS